MPEWLNEYIDAVQGLFVQQPILASVVSAFLAGTFSFLIRPVREFFFRLGGRSTQFWSALMRLERANKAVEGRGVWLTQPIERPPGYSDFFLDPIPILTVANLKGGVGKTTAAANISAFFAAERGERVLLIDLDFQGSLSSMLVSNAHRIPAAGQLSTASRLLSGEISPNHLWDMARPVLRLESAQAIPAYYDLSRTENRLMVHWLTRKEKRDVRYVLARLLHAPEVRTHFDRIIIDASPRLNAGTIAALCASTHVLIPTVLDVLSGEAVGSFIRELEAHRSALWPNLRVVGVAPQLVSANLARWKDEHPDASDEEVLARLINSEREGHAEIRRSIERVQKDLALAHPPARILPPEAFIQRAAPIAQSAGRSIAFLDINNDLKQMFRNLGTEVATRMMGPNGQR